MKPVLASTANGTMEVVSANAKEKALLLPCKYRRDEQTLITYNLTIEW